MTFTKKIFLLAATCLTCTAIMTAAVPAQSQPDGPKGYKGRHFEKLDTDGDGKISYQEHQARSDERFASGDLDGDGFITKEEMEQVRADRRAERKGKRFEAMDADGDGVVTREEADAFWAEAKERRKERCGGRGPRS